MRIAAAVFGLAGILWGQAAEPKLGKIEGKVVHSVTGAVVPRVSLTLMPAGQPTSVPTAAPDRPAGVASSKADGSFSFTKVPAGTYLIRGERDGFLVAFYGSPNRTTPASMVRLTGGQEITGLTFQLARESVVVINVLDENRKPAPRIGIQLLRNRFVGSQAMPDVVFSGATNEQGESRISMGAGRYYARAMVAPAIGVRPRQPGQTADEIPVNTYFPSAIDSASASPIVVGSAGREVRATINLQKRRTFRVRGAVPSKLLRGQLLLIPKNRESAMRNGTARPDAAFEFSGVVPGSYYLLAGGPGVNTMTNPSLRAVVDVTDRDVERVAFQPVESQTLKGRVIVEGDTDKDKIDFSKMGIWAMPLDGLPGMLNDAMPAADGTFALRDLPLGRYRFRLVSSQPGYVKAIRFGSLDVTLGSVDWNGTASSPPIEIIYSRRAATVDVHVVRNSSKSNLGAVLLVPESPRGAAVLPIELGYLPLSVDPAGLATTPLAPGKYRVYALETYEMTEGIDPAVLKRLESRAVRINVAEGEKATVSVKQLRPADLETR